MCHKTKPKPNQTKPNQNQTKPKPNQTKVSWFGSSPIFI